MDSLGERIKSGRLAGGLTQAELAKKLGVSDALIGHWETGLHVPPADRLAALEKIIGRLAPDVRTGAVQQPYEAVPIAGRWLQRALNKKGWTVVELAEKSGVSQATLYNLQNGRAENPRRSTIEKLEKVLGQPMPNDVKEEIEEGSEIQGLGELIDFDPHDSSEIPDEPGVYVLYDITERSIYVGQGMVISRRIKEHGDKFWFRRPIVNNAAYLKVPDKTMRERVEKILIKFLKKNAVINQQGVDRE